MTFLKYINPFSEKSQSLSKDFDIATINKDIPQIQKLISSAESLLINEDRASQAQIYYSIGTGYGDILMMKGIYDEDSVKSQLFYYRKSIELIECEEYNKEEYSPYINVFKSSLYTNYANILDSCGRKIAAIEQYKKALFYQPNFGMAIGNLGRIYQHYGDLDYDDGHRSFFHHFAYNYLKMAIATKDPNTHEMAKKCFKSRIEIYDKDCINEFLEKPLIIEKYEYDDPEELAYRQWVLENNLFLNTLNDLPVNDLCFAADVINLPNMIVHIKAKPIYHGMYNQLKQEYIYARYLYYYTLSTSSEPHFADKETFLLNFADYPLYSIRIEQLKSAFKTLYGLFDKIAYFINSYFDLGIHERDVSFHSIWYKSHGIGKKQYSYKNTLCPESNFALGALYWIGKDYFDILEKTPNPFLKRINEVRNALEHKYVKISWSPFSNRTNGKIDDLALYVTEDELYNITFQLLKTIREAIICLSLCVNIEEINKKASYPSDTFMPTIDFLSYDDEWKI